MSTSHFPTLSAVGIIVDIDNNTLLRDVYHFLFSLENYIRKFSLN